jgi:hypothetical protein
MGPEPSYPLSIHLYIHPSICPTNKYIHTMHPSIHPFSASFYPSIHLIHPCSSTSSIRPKGLLRLLKFGFPSFPRPSTAPYALKLIVRHLTGNYSVHSSIHVTCTSIYPCIHPFSQCFHLSLRPVNLPTLCIHPPVQCIHPLLHTCV